MSSRTAITMIGSEKFFLEKMSLVGGREILKSVNRSVCDGISRFSSSIRYILSQSFAVVIRQFYFSVLSENAYTDELIDGILISVRQ